MASSGAVVSIGFGATAPAIAGGISGGICALAFAMAASTFATGGSLTYDATRRKDWLPKPDHPLAWVTVNGRQVPIVMDRTWYRFFREIAENRLGGLDAPTVGEVAMNVTETKSAVTDISQQASSAYQTAASAVSTANATREVAQTNGLSGSASIPSAKTYAYGGGVIP